MNIKLVVSDIDGTLIGSDRQIKPVIDEIGNLIKEKNIPFTMASGRIPARIGQLKERLGVTLPVIGCNGGCAVKGEEFLWNDFIPVRFLRPAIEKADKLGMSVVFTDGVKEFAYRKTEWIRDLMETYNRYDGVFVPQGKEWEENSVQKVLIADAPSLEVQQQVTKELVPFLNKMKVVEYPDGTLDIMAKTADKEEAVRRLAEYLHIEREEVMAIGDHENDIGMIRFAGVGVAVANATPSLKDKADYVCAREMAEGVLEALKLYFK